MKGWINLLLLTSILVVGVVNVLMYWSTHLYYRSTGRDDLESRIGLLEQAERIYPGNDRVHHELGRAYFDLGVEYLMDTEEGSLALEKSALGFTRAIGINPANKFSHFNYAQTLQYLSILGGLPGSAPTDTFNPFAEYKKAAKLAGHNSQIYFEVGKVLLSDWDRLSDYEKDFAVEVLQKITEGDQKKKLRELLYVWEMNVEDFDVLDRILPDDPEIYKSFAGFLGEKSMMFEERQKLLAKAEQLEFKQAEDEFKASLNRLKRIKFYVIPDKEKLIDMEEFKMLQKLCLLNLVNCRIQEGADLMEFGEYLLEFLKMENNVAVVTELERQMINQGLLDKKLGISYDDFERLYLHLLLNFKQTRYREIIGIGRTISESVVVVPESKKTGYAKVLSLIGEAFHKLAYHYDAIEFFEKALEFESNSLETLVKVRNSYETISKENKLSEIDNKINELITEKQIGVRSGNIRKGRKFTRNLLFAGAQIELSLEFRAAGKKIKPLVTVLFNGRLAWEGYLNEKMVSMQVETKIGRNSMEIVPVNSDVQLRRITWKPVGN